MYVFQTVFLTVTQGMFVCTSFVACNDAGLPNATNCTTFSADVPTPDCAVPGTTELPPVTITVDYGDGSGPNTWSQGNKLVLWSHVYTRPGKFRVSVKCMEQLTCMLETD